MSAELQMLAQADVPAPFDKRRILVEHGHPPQPAETMQQIGISETNLDGPVCS
jgi:hypothetical protein